MKRLMAMVLAGGVVLAGASLRAETITINDVSGAAGSVVPVPVYISGGANVSAVALAFSVGDGGPVLGGTQTISIKSVDYLTGTIWSGQALAPVVEVPALPAQSATVVEISLGTPGANVAASGLLMTFMLRPRLSDP